MHTARRVILRANSGLPIAFAGSSGTWTVVGHLVSPRQLVAISPMGEDAVSRVLILLSGGAIRVSSGHVGVPVLRVPDAGEPGRRWFECVKQRLFP